MSNYNYSKQLTKSSKLLILLIIISIPFVSFLFKLFSMQIINGDHYRLQSQTISSQVSIIPAQRGEIFDRNANMPMVINTETFVVNVTPGEIHSNRYDTVISRLAKFLNISKSVIDKKIPKNMRKSYSAIQVKANVNFNTILNIAERK